MNITEIRVKQVSDSTDRLKAYCSITIDGCFVVRDLKVIEGTSGPFVAMPSRKLAARCHSCGTKNHLRARFCNDCGKQLTETAAFKGADRNKLHADVAHPINTECRKFIQARVIEAYKAELERSREPGYVPTSYDDDLEDRGSPYDELIEELKGEQTQGQATGQATPGPGAAEEESGDSSEQPAPTRAATEPGGAEAADEENFGAGLL